jgi:hypothetical protein
MKQIHTEVEIEAPAERVWDVLTDLANYPQWNPLIRQASGKVEEGERLTLRIEPPDLWGRTFQVLVVRVEPCREFRWLGKLLVTGLLDGDHTFLIDSVGPGRVRVVQRENFSGLLVPILARKLVPNMRRGFENLNRALEDRVKQLQTGSASGTAR